MTNVLLIIAYFEVLLALTKPLGIFLHRALNGERNALSPVLGPVERGTYRLAGVDPAREMRWTTYLVALLRSARHDARRAGGSNGFLTSHDAILTPF